MSFRPVDDETRQRARDELRTSFVVEAGAGTGKTTLLLDRVENLVRTGEAGLDEIAAVTFTENAATAMKLRLREHLEQARADDTAPGRQRERAARALDVLERAQVSTIHALCAAILQERPLECGVTPGFEVMDDARTDALFAEAWEQWLSDSLAAGDDLILEAMDHGIPLEGQGRFGERGSLRGLARALLEQRDLRPLAADAPPELDAWREELLARAKRAGALSADAQGDDTLAARLQSLVGFAEASRSLEGAGLERHLRDLPVIGKNLGQKGKWPTPEHLSEARELAAWTKATSESWSKALGAALHGRLVRGLTGVVKHYEAKKAADGGLDFLDLLIKTRDALRDRPSVRRYLHGRFRYVIIDEFQDTDPLQVEIAQLLAGDEPGRLVVVGDAKQSIYRFRRAEVALFRRLADEARDAPGRGVLHLTQNFRSRPAILRFVNRAFAELILRSDEAGQPAYEAIMPCPGFPEEPSVLALRFAAPFAEGPSLLEAEATALAALVAQVAAGGHEVRDPITGAGRPSRAGDVMVLSRRLTQIRYLEQALEAAGLRFAVEGGKSFFDRQEVHEVLSVLRAVEDPGDRVALVAALRSSFFGVSDRDIVAHVLGGGSWRLRDAAKSRSGSPSLAPAFALLDELHRQRTRVAVPELLERLYDETRILAALTGTRRGEAQIANLRKVTTLARRARDLGVLTLRGFGDLLGQRMADAREEPDLPATRPGDPETVRILSIHKAKGLEAPVVALYDTADGNKGGSDVISLWEEGTVAVGFRGGCQPPGWDTLKRRDDARSWAEGRRLLYVACTRARDYLIIPQPPADARVGGFWKDLIEFLPASSDADVRVIDAETLPSPLVERPPPDLRALAAAQGSDPVAERWDRERAGLIEAAARRPYTPIPATRYAARQAPASVAAAAAAGGRDFGSLVHQILEWIPLDAADPEAKTAAMAEALAPSMGLDAEAAARGAEAAARALALPVMERARKARRVWRELKLWLPEGEELIEGAADLVFEEEDGLVVVDYKTDHITQDQKLAQAAHHAPQLQLYGRGLARATGQPVRERLVLFTTLGETVAV